MDWIVYRSMQRKDEKWTDMYAFTPPSYRNRREGVGKK